MTGYDTTAGRHIVNMNTPATFRGVAADTDGMAVIGRTLHDLRGIRFVEGEGGNQPPAGQQTSTDPNPPTGATPPAPPAAPTPLTTVHQPGQNANPPAPGSQPNPAAPPATPSNDVPVNPKTGQPFTAAETQERITALNAEARQYRIDKEAAETAKAEQEQKLNAVLSALGIKQDGSPADLTPDQLQARLQQTTGAAEQTARENLLLRVALPMNVNADKLLDSKSFTDKLSAIKADDRAGLESLLKDTVKNDPSYLVTSAAAASGGAPHTGTNSSNQRKSKAEALAERYGQAAPTGQTGQ